MKKDPRNVALDWALNQAVARDDIKQAKHLIAQGADVNFVPDTTVLMRCAATSFNLELFKAMAKDPKVLSVTDSRGWNAMMYALEAGNLGVVRYCVRQGVPVNNDSRFDQPLSVAIKSGRMGIVKFLIKAGAQVDTPDCDGRTPIMHALASGNDEAALMLVDHHADLQACDHAGKSVLRYLMENNNLAVLKYCLDLGRLDLSDDILFEAVRSGADLDIVKYLVGKGIDPLAEGGGNPPGTLLREAVRGEKEEVVKYLLKQGAAMGEDILEVAARTGNLDIIKQIKKYDPPCGDGRRVIDAVVQSKSVKLLASVMDRIRVLDRNEQHRLLFVAVRSGSEDVYEMLRDELDLDVDCRDDAGANLLFAAVVLDKPVLPEGRSLVFEEDLPRIRGTVSDRIGRYELLRNLVEKERLDVDLADMHGDTAAIVAARNLNLPAVRFLQQHGADLQAENGKGESALGLVAAANLESAVQRKLERTMAEGTCLGRRSPIRRRKGSPRILSRD
jgi:ankyrin repeat protein